MKHPLWAAPTLGLMLVLWTGCQKESGEPVKPVYSPEKSVTTAIHAAGFRVLESTCFSCHSPDATQESRVAPPMIAIKQHYLTGGTTKEDFTEALLAFMNHPTIEISKMPNAVQRFGLMPKMSLPEADIRSIAAYLYDTPIEAPGWFAAHFEQERKKYQNDPAHQSPIVQGQQLAMAAKAELGKNLLQAIKTKGTEGAVAFCNTRAIPLTDSMAQALSVHLRRVSDAPRNPKNQANTSELAYIQAVKTALAKGEQPKPLMQMVAGKQVGYYPIVTNATCLQCHGRPKTDIQPMVMQKIRSLYPKDKGIGYGENQLRGIWVVGVPPR